jgi:WhiB family redox-sensing transcriptional regulator
MIVGLANSIARPEPWTERAVCAQTDPEKFFPKKGNSTRDAKGVCGGCPVRIQCLQYALDHDERFGVWGGCSERERREMKRQQKALHPSERVKCRNGHDLTEAGTRNSGECAQCSRDRSRDYYDRNFRRERRGREHGTRSMYNTGCRCTACGDANTRYQREKRWLKGTA